MKINTTISSEIIGKKMYLKNKTHIFCFIIIASAIITGTLSYINFEESFIDEIQRSFEVFSVEFISKTKFEIFSGVLLSHLPYIILMIVFGTSVFGSIFAVALSFIKGTGLGMLGAYIYSSFGLKGIEYAILVFFPGKFLLLLSMLFLLNFAVTESLYLNKLTKGEWQVEKDNMLYIMKITVSFIFIIFSALIDCFLVSAFSSLFTF